MKYLQTIIGVFVVLVLGAILFAWSGLYDIAATEPHWGVTVSLIDLLRDRSIAVHSEGVQAPNLDGPQYREAAAGHYHGMCRLCHGAPGASANEFAKGLYPPPPDLTSAAVQETRSTAEMYWIVKHGIKMTGMPAFGPTHDEPELWGLVALVREMADMTPEGYARKIEAARSGRQTGNGHTHGASGRQGNQDHGEDSEPAAHDDGHAHD